jgi:hypothetical protein
MKQLVRLLSLLIALAAAPALALDPERRDVVVVSARVWDGFAYKETFTPSTQLQLSLMAGHDNALGFVRTQEYYWPLSRQVYVDFEARREALEGNLQISRDGATVADVPLVPYVIVYPDGARAGTGSLLWGETALTAYADYQQQEHDFARALVAAQRAHSLYERQLLEAGAARQKGQPAEVIAPPPPVPEPSLRLVTAPMPGYRVSLDPGLYQAELKAADGTPVAGTLRSLRVIDLQGTGTVVADIVPEERWTRPLASNSAASRVYARPGSVFFVTLTEASRFDEVDYLSVVTPQADAVAGRTLWVRRQPFTPAALHSSWEGAANADMALQALRIEQTQGSGFGYRVRAAEPSETADLTAFMVSVPDSPGVRRGSLTLETGFLRDVVIVHRRNTMAATLLALLPLAGFLAWLLARRRLSSPS